MKIPEIQSVNKLRDTLICMLYLNGYSQEEIATDKRVNLSQTQVGRILYKQRQVLILDKNYEKIKRINWLKKQVTKDSVSKKDPADIQAQIKDEIEGMKIEHTGIPGTNITVSPATTFIFRDIKEASSDRSPDALEGAEGNRLEEKV